MIRLLGGALIAVSAAAFGFSFSLSLKEEYRTFEALLRLGRQLRERIACFRQPLSEIYAEYDDPILERCGFLAEVRKVGFLPALHKKETALGVRRELLLLLYDFGQGLGERFAEEQLRHCDRCLSRMEEALLSLEKELPVRTRLIKTLTVTSAAMVLILLL